MSLFMTYSLPMGPKLKPALGKYFYFIIIIFTIKSITW